MKIKPEILYKFDYSIDNNEDRSPRDQFKDFIREFNGDCAAVVEFLEIVLNTITCDHKLMKLLVSSTDHLFKYDEEKNTILDKYNGSSINDFITFLRRYKFQSKTINSFKLLKTYAESTDNFNIKIEKLKTLIENSNFYTIINKIDYEKIIITHNELNSILVLDNIKAINDNYKKIYDMMVVTKKGKGKDRELKEDFINQAICISADKTSVIIEDSRKKLLISNSNTVAINFVSLFSNKAVKKRTMQTFEFINDKYKCKLLDTVLV